MNRKTKYYTRNDSRLERLRAFTLLQLLYAGDEAAALGLESLWLKHESAILDVWRQVFPATRPGIWWWLNFPDVWQQLKAKTIHGLFHLRPEPESQRAALIEVGELEGDEYLAEQREFSFAVFLKAYRA